MEQRSEEWFEARKGRITASAAGAFLGNHPYMTRDQAIRRMVREAKGAEQEFTGNAATDYGEEHEQDALEWLAMELDAVLGPCSFFPYEDWLGASPDAIGVDGDDKFLVEVKCPYGARKTGDFKDLEDQPHYYAQIQLQMFCTGIHRTAFVQWSSGGARYRWVDYDEGYVEHDLLPALWDAYQEYQKELDNPAHLEPLEKDLSADSNFRVLEDRYVQAASQKDELDAELKALKEQMVAHAGHSKARGAKVIVFPVEKKGSIAYAKALKEIAPDADLEQYRGKPSVSYSVRAIK